ncbi:flagellar motor switch protein FliM [Rhodothermaceae bacterium RA]|nr:flagellar motor switch protein FliM [Rhodothermaceae bacterium RA]
MAKQLTQEEIDILLDVRSQMSMAEDYGLDVLETMMTADQEKRVTPYNFKRPRLFSQDQMRVIGHVHEAFAREFSVYLSAQLRTIVDITLTAVDQVLYSEFVMSSAPPSALYVMEAVDMDQKIVFELDPRLVIYTIEKLFGGPGVFLQRPREPSRIEQRVMSKVMARAFVGLEKAWGQAYEIHFREVAFESNAEFVQIIPGVEPAIVCTFEVVIYDQRSFINICYPYILLERMLGRTGMKQWISSATTRVEPEVRQRYENNLRSMTVELRAMLGSTRLSVSELMQLEVGDVIPLERRTNEAVQVLIGNTEKFRAVAGQSGRRRALRILDVVDSPMIED